MMPGVSPRETHAGSDLTPQCWDHMDPPSLPCLAVDADAGYWLRSCLGLADQRTCTGALT